MGVGVTIHDEAHDAFMTLPPYARTREGEAPQLVNRCRKQPAQQEKSVLWSKL